MPGQTPGRDQIIASNVFALKAMVDAAGGEAIILPIAPDREDALAAAMAEMLKADIAVTIGGASVGDHDLVGRVGERLGLERAFYKLAMRPGKPLIAGSLGAVPYLGLPGNPVSAIVTGHLFLVPMVKRWLGLEDVQPKRVSARLAQDVGPIGTTDAFHARAAGRRQRHALCAARQLAAQCAVRRQRAAGTALG
ncbi:molybdopterin-binding protein [Novosphingobium sp. MW5]|nr:molybdopterin-binding protein [Novosphingobium sp. MW5]